MHLLSFTDHNTNRDHFSNECRLVLRMKTGTVFYRAEMGLEIEFDECRHGKEIEMEIGGWIS